MEIFRAITTVIGVGLLCVAFCLLYVTLGYRKGMTAKCKGYLEETTRYKNYRIPVSRSGRIYKNWVKYVYIYTVNGKKYRISGGGPGVKGNLSNTVTIVYQKRNPKFAHEEGLKFPIVETVLTVGSFLLGLVFLCLGAI